MNYDDKEPEIDKDTETVAIAIAAFPTFGNSHRRWVDLFLHEKVQFRQYARSAIDTLKSLGWLSPADIAARDAAVTAKALQMAAEKCDYYDANSHGSLDADPFKAAQQAAHELRNAILSLSPDTTETATEAALDAADRAHNRLAYYATMAHNGKVELSGREMSRQVWGAFGDFYAVKHPHVEKVRATSKAIYDAEHGGEPAPWDRNETAPQGYVMVPETPTEAMCAHGGAELDRYDKETDFLGIAAKRIYRAMIGKAKP